MVERLIHLHFFGSIIEVQHDVMGLQISVNDICFVDAQERIDNLSDDVMNLVLSEKASHLYEFEKIDTVAILHYYEIRSPCLLHIMDLDDVSLIKLLHCL